jgi:hypothetical protein
MGQNLQGVSLPLLIDIIILFVWYFIQEKNILWLSLNSYELSKYFIFISFIYIPSFQAFLKFT